MARVSIVSGMASNPYPKPKEHVPRWTHCELCDRQLPTKDWHTHKNSKKHRQAEAKEREQLEMAGSSTTFGGEGMDSNTNNESANVNDFGFGDTFGIDTTAGDGGWSTGDGFATTKSNGYKNGGGGDQRSCYGCGQTGHQKRDCPQGSTGQACYNCGESGY